GGVLEQVEADMGGGNRQAVRLDHPGQTRRIAKQAGVRLDLRITQRRQLLEDGLERREIAGAIKLEREVRHSGLLSESDGRFATSRPRRHPARRASPCFPAISLQSIAGCSPPTPFGAPRNHDTNSRTATPQLSSGKPSE